MPLLRGEAAQLSARNAYRVRRLPYSPRSGKAVLPPYPARA